MAEPSLHRRGAIGIAVLLAAGGSAIYWAFRFTHFPGLMVAGLAWLAVGLLLLPIGLWLAARSPRPRALPLALVLLNLPLAAVYTVSGVDAETRVEVRVRNLAAETLRDARLTGFGGSLPLGDLAPGESRRAVLRPDREGSLVLVFSAAASERKEDLDLYVGRNTGGYADVTVAPDFKVTIRTDRPAFEWPILP